MPTLSDTSERRLAKLSRVLSKLSLKTDDAQRWRRDLSKPSPGFTPEAPKSPWVIPIPPGISHDRAREYVHSTSLTSNGKLFLPQYSEIIPDRLFISDRYTGTEAAVLSQLCITHVVCIVNSSTQICQPLLGIRQYDMVVPRDTYNAHGLLAHIDDTVEFIDNALRKNGARVLIHCRAGVDWSPGVAIAWLMRNKKCTYEVGKELLKQKREVVNPSLDLEIGVREWWALELARPLFPPGRGGFVTRFTVDVGSLDDDSLGEVIDIR